MSRSTNQLIELGGFALAAFLVVRYGLPWIEQSAAKLFPGESSAGGSSIAVDAPSRLNKAIPQQTDDDVSTYDGLLSADTPGTSFALIQQGLADGLGAVGMGGLLANQTAYMQAYYQQLAFGGLVSPTPSGGSGGRNPTYSPPRAM
jgi:hypothetical protein